MIEAKTRMRITAIAWAVAGVAGLVALTILFLPDRAFLAFSNYLQIIAAIMGALVFLYLWHRSKNQASWLWAAGGFFVWGAANIAWYVNVFMGMRALVFPSIIDIGMIASFLLFAVAFRKGLPVTPVSPALRYGIPAFCVLVPAVIIAVAGAGTAAIVTLAYFLACGTFLLLGLRHSLARKPLLLAGAVLFAVAFMVYPVREMFFVTVPALSIIGTFVSAGFALMVIGWVPDA